MQKYSIPPGYNVLQSILRSYKQVKDPIGSMEESMRRFGGTYSVRLGTNKFIITQDPALIDHVLRGNHRNYNKSAIQTEQLGRFLGNGLLTVNGEYWLRQRRLIQPGFHAERIHGLYEIIQRSVNTFLNSVPTDRQVDVYPLMNKLAFRIVINTLFNVNVSEAIQTELGRLIYEIQDFIIRYLRQFYKRWWYQLSGEDALNLKKSKRVREIIREMIQQRKGSHGKFNDLLDMLLEARYEDNGEAMTEDQLIDEITILIIAGHETTANALSWSLYLLAIHPEQQTKLRNECVGSLQDAVVSEALNNVIRETMRLYPPAWISDRVCLKNDRFNTFDIPSDTILILFYYGMHRDPGIWEDADSFKPERFGKNHHDKEKNKTYFPFGAGPRLCIGNNFAMAEMAIFLQQFMARFKVIPSDVKPTLTPLVTLKPDKIILTLSPIP
jgi:cytochrome P450